MSLFSAVRSLAWVKSVELLDRVQEPDRDLTYLKIQVTTGWVMYLRELFTPEEKFYSYHLQDESDGLILRYDNAHGYSDIATSPHHKHPKGNKVEPLFDPSLEVFLREVENLLDQDA